MTGRFLAPARLAHASASDVRRQTCLGCVRVWCVLKEEEEEKKKNLYCR